MIAGLTLSLVVGACGSGGSGSSKPGGATVTIKNFAFSPTPLSARVGDTVTVRNTDSTGHTLTADDGSVDTGTVAGGASGTVKLTKAGTLAYHCSIHDYMKGVIQVGP